MPVRLKHSLNFLPALMRGPLRAVGFASMLAVSTSVAFSADALPTQDIVGEASMTIGTVKATSADGVARSLERGSPIRVGDKIETGDGGHVHIRFVDGGRLSVRPSSRLQVENYAKSSGASAVTTIKFRLDEGVVRSITGSWGEAARDRFRLNTPVAAIGIKGTDFVVKTDINNTLASVYTGAIILTPLASGCQTSLGPCQNGSEKLLTEDMKGQMLALGRLQVIPQLVPAVDLLAQRTRPASTDVIAKSDPTIKAEGARSEAANEKVLVNESRAVDVVAISKSTSDANAVVSPVLPTPLPVVLPAEVNQLVWARLAAVAADGDTISRSFAQAMQSGREGTVGNGTYSLFRGVPAAGSAILASSDTFANFRLAGAAAQLVRTEQGVDFIETVQVGGGTLNVDFAKATYATQLNVSSSRIGADVVTSNGLVKPNGVLQTQGGNAFTSGALSLDGKEAGYFFLKSLPAGQLSGITQWGR
jgi:FecR protein